MQVQPRRRRGHRSAAAGKDCLVSLSIRQAVDALDVWRQRHVPDGLDDLRDAFAVSRPEPDGAAAECVLCEDFGFELDRWLAEPCARARFHLLPGMHQHIPVLVVDLTQQQALDVTAAGLATAKQPCRHDTRVVDDEQVQREPAGPAGPRSFDRSTCLGRDRRPAGARRHARPTAVVRSGGGGEKKWSSERRTNGS